MEMDTDPAAIMGMVSNYQCATRTGTRHAKGFLAWLVGECGLKGRGFERKEET